VQTAAISLKASRELGAAAAASVSEPLAMSPSSPSLHSFTVGLEELVSTVSPLNATERIGSFLF